MAEPAHLAVARSLIGTIKDGPQVPQIAREIGQAFPDMASYCALARATTSWCGIFIALCLLRAYRTRPPFNAGNELLSFMWVDAWEDSGWGTSVPQGQEQPGDILVFRSPHHITFFVADEGERYRCIGGNQSDGVTETTFAKSGLRSIRRLDPTAAVAIPLPSAWSASGRGSWYSQYNGKYKWVDTGDAPGSAALGVPDDAQGIALYDRNTLGQWFEVLAPNDVISIEQQTDIGPHPNTGRLIDIAAAAAERFGYSPSNFPTDSIFSWRPVAAPAVVAGLSPQQQATRYRDLRTEQPMAEQTDLAAIAKAIQDLAGSIATMKLEISTLRSLVTGEPVKPTEPSKPPVATAPPATTPNNPTNPLNFGTLILSAIGAILGPATGVTDSVDKGTLGSLLPYATAAASAVGIPAWILPVAGRFLGRIFSK